MKKALVIILAIIAAVVGATIGKGVVKSLFDVYRDAKIERSLVKSVEEINASSPKMVDEITRLDGAQAGPGKKLTYLYTIVSLKAADVPPAIWNEQAAPNVKKQMQEAKALRPLFEAGVTVHCKYSGSDSVYINEVVITPADVIGK